MPRYASQSPPAPPDSVVPQRLRESLAVLRAQKIPFSFAWNMALNDVCPVVGRPQEWREIFESQESEWRAAYYGGRTAFGAANVGITSEGVVCAASAVR